MIWAQAERAVGPHSRRPRAGPFRRPQDAAGCRSPARGHGAAARVPGPDAARREPRRGGRLRRSRPTRRPTRPRADRGPGRRALVGVRAPVRPGRAGRKVLRLWVASSAGGNTPWWSFLVCAGRGSSTRASLPRTPSRAASRRSRASEARPGSNQEDRVRSVRRAPWSSRVRTPCGASRATRLAWLAASLSSTSRTRPRGRASPARPSGCAR